MTYLTKSHSLHRTLLLLVLSVCLPALAQEGTAVVQKSSERRVHAMGGSWRLSVYNTSNPEVVMIRADHPVLVTVARALGRNLTWTPADTRLTGDNNVSVGLGDQQISVLGEKRDLELPLQVIDGAVHLPSSALEGLLNCKVTVKEGRTGAIYVEPVIEAVRFEKDGSRSTDLVVRTSVPVRKKIFTLNNPRRTVVDLVGVCLPKGLEKVEHPVLGEIRLGQFQAAPSITRVVIPTGTGVKVGTERTLDLYEHQLTVTWPAGTRPMAQSGVGERVPVIKIQPTKMPDRVGTPAVEISTDTRPEANPAPEESTEQEQTEEEVPVLTNRRPVLASVKWEGDVLICTFSEPVDYRWSRVNAGQNRYVLDFPGVIFPQKRQNMESHIPGLQGVRIVQNMPEPDPIVRLVCDLASPLAVEAQGADERVLKLQFPGRRVSASDLTSGGGNTSKKAVAIAITGGNGKPNGRTVCIDAGHGGSDPGALNRQVGINEAKVTLDIALKLANYLRAQGWNVIMTRTTDRDVSWAGSSAKEELGARAQVANRNGADLFVSIHANASVNPGAGGTSIHWYKSGDYRLATHLESGVMGATGRANRGLVKDRFYVLAHTSMPAVLIETAFLSNPTEGKLLADPNYRDGIARGIAAGLQMYAARNFTNTAAQK